MLNILEDDLRKSLPEGLKTGEGLKAKVDETGDFRPFRGNTAVFLLDGKTRQELAKLQDSLHKAAGYMLAKKLAPAAFHMTLHDLENVSNPDPGDTRPLEERMMQAEERVKLLLGQWKDRPPLKMQTLHLFSMVNTSVVLCLKPKDEDSRKRLDEMYCALQDVKYLGYGLTPHITMAYFRPGTYSAFETEPLRKIQEPEPLDVELRMEDLVFQIFTDMNHYENA